MARHSSVSKAARNDQRAKARIETELSKLTGDDPSLRFKGYDRLLGEAKHHFETVAALSAVKGEGAVTARRKLREMRDVKYFTDKATKPGELHQKQGGKVLNPARGSTGRAKKLLSGHNARKSQGKGI